MSGTTLTTAIAYDGISKSVYVKSLILGRMESAFDCALAAKLNDVMQAYLISVGGQPTADGAVVIAEKVLLEALKP